MKEATYQAMLKDKIKVLLPGCMVSKLDPGDTRGIPDLVIFFGDRWATLEVKKKENAPKQPLQQYWVDLMNNMSFSSFIFPENEEEVLNDLQQALRAGRETCVPES